jgi:hypothetical protein
VGIFIKTEKWIVYGKYLFFVVFSALVILMVLQLYFLNLKVSSTALYKKDIARLAEMKNEYQQLESDYIQIINQLNIEYAQAAGFVVADPDGFVRREKAVAQQFAHDTTFR